MPNLVGPETVDTASTDGNCLYPPLALGGTPYPTKVVVGGNPLLIYDNTSVPAPVQGQKINPSPIPCQPAQRVIRPTVNNTVFINGRLPAVTGDEAQMVIGSTPRPLTGPFQHPTIVIGSNLSN
tara:strand:- start:814 stop:1185 length:372 start_codon:yes stop_codon:yes gene_type:complete